MAGHDNSYKLLFSHPCMVEDLLRGFVREQWICELSFASAQKLGGRTVTDDLRDRESDIVWRIPRGEDSDASSVYVLIEFQSTPDPLMVLRLHTYVGLLYQDLVRRHELTHAGRLPGLLPVVIYNGKRRWSAAREIAELVEPDSSELRRYSLRLCYFLLDEGAMPDGELPPPDNLVGLLISMERSRRAEDLAHWVTQLSQQLSAPEHNQLRRDFTVWIKRVLFPVRFPGRELPELNDLEDVQTMLAETVIEWTREWKQEGIEEGLQKGEAAILCRLLTRRFGPLPPDVSQHIQTASLEQLEHWADRVLEAATLDEVLRTD